MLLRMTGIWFLYVEVLGRVGVSGGSSEDLVLCRVGGSVGELVVLRFLRLRFLRLRFLRLRCLRCQQINLLWLIRSENPGVYAAELRPRAKPGYVHSLSCDPVKFSQDLGRANLTLAFTQNRRLLASRPTSELLSSLHCIFYAFEL